VRCLSMIFLCFFLFITGQTQTEVALGGVVFTAAHKTLPGVEVRIVGGGQDVTTSSGEFSIRLPATRIGQRVTLQVTKRGWEVVDARELSVIVPSDRVQYPIRITMRQLPTKLPRLNSPRLSPSPEANKCVVRVPGRAASFSVTAQCHPSGIMGDIDDVTFGRYATLDAFTYETKGRGPHEWDHTYVKGELNPRSARFAGVMYLSPPNNWGREGGFDLRGVRKAIKWEARSLAGDVNVEFVIGGVVWKWDHEKKTQVGVSCPDSMPRTSLGIRTLTSNWQPFDWDLSQLPEDAFKSVIGAFAWTIEWGSNGVDPNDAGTAAVRPKTFKIELRNVRYERGGASERKDSHRSNR
jgi:hypothetical protein